MDKETATQLVDQIVELYQADLDSYRKLLELNRQFEYDSANTSIEQEPDLGSYAAEREGVITALQQREHEETALRHKVCYGLKIEGFSVGELGPFLPPSLTKRLRECISDIQAVVKQVAELDHAIQNRLKAEMEAAKLDLQRLQNSTRLRQTYGNPSMIEARFIDKNK